MCFWLLPGKIFYFVDSKSNKVECGQKIYLFLFLPNKCPLCIRYYQVDAFDFDEASGSISNRRTVFDLRAHGIAEGFPNSFPDGIAVDRSGNLWVACFGTGKVNQETKTVKES